MTKKEKKRKVVRKSLFDAPRQRKHWQEVERPKVKRKVDKLDKDLKRYPKTLQALGKVGNFMATTNPFLFGFGAPEGVYRASRIASKLRRRKTANK